MLPTSAANGASTPATLLTAARQARSILLTGPMDPDGDSIGACLTLARAIHMLSDARVVVAGSACFRYAWMPGTDQMVPDDDLPGVMAGETFDLAVVLDGDRRRLEPNTEAAFQAARSRGIVDHHRSTDPDGYDIVLIDRDSASTCELVHGLLLDWGIPLDADLAALLYVGLIFDTGGFRHSNTSPDTHRLAATLLDTGIDHAAIAVRILSERTIHGVRLLGHVLERASFLHGERVALASVSHDDARRIGADNGDAEGIVDALLYTRGVKLACLAIEKAPGKVKLSLRSRKAVDVARFARSLDPGGGGHARAAGVMLVEPLGQVMARLPALLAAAVDQAS